MVLPFLNFCLWKELELNHENGNEKANLHFIWFYIPKNDSSIREESYSQIRKKVKKKGKKWKKKERKKGKM